MEYWRWWLFLAESCHNISETEQDSKVAVDQ